MSGAVNNEKGLLSVIGLCRGAGRAVIGVGMICETLKKRGEGREASDVMVIEASDTSENTHKRVSDRCAYYNVRHLRIESDCLALGKAVGKGAVGAVMINDENFCRAIDKQLMK
jgi:ribosomal protein L7Ae-like RNA K-turn-binding protein